MGHYEKVVNSFLSGVSRNMSAVYLPVLLIALINTLENYFKMDRIEVRRFIEERRNSLYIDIRIVTAHFLHYLIEVRKNIPDIRMTPVRGRSHEERFLEGFEGSTASPTDLLATGEHLTRIERITRDMLDYENVYPVFERRCPVFRLSPDRLEMDPAAVETLLRNSILYTKMAEMVCSQYLVRLRSNRHLTSHILNYFARGSGRDAFSRQDYSYALEYQENDCFYCGRSLVAAGSINTRPEADHFIPWVFVRSSTIENLVVACRDCKSEKLDRLPAIGFFNRLLRRNEPRSEFWTHYPGSVSGIEERVEQWIKQYYLAAEQLSAGWKPSLGTCCSDTS